MISKPSDNKLGKRDSATLAAYRDKIDPEGRGVAWVRSGCGIWAKVRCDVCWRYIVQSDQREFALKPALKESDLRFVCNTCCQNAWEARNVR